MLDEATRRKIIIMAAREEFILPGITNNITEALRLYILAHQEECKFINLTITQRDKDRPKTIVDNYVRPLCPNCDEILFLQPKCSGLQKGDYFYIWTCKKCGYQEYTELTLPEILQTLKPKRNV